MFPGQTEVVDTNGTPDAEDFLARERALLGEDADQFATPNDHITASAAVGDLNDDLLGGGDDAQPAAVTTSDEVSGFESSFPAIEPTQNQVRKAYYILFLYCCQRRTTG